MILVAIQFDPKCATTRTTGCDGLQGRTAELQPEHTSQIRVDAQGSGAGSPTRVREGHPLQGPTAQNAPGFATSLDVDGPVDVAGRA